MSDYRDLSSLNDTFRLQCALRSAVTEKFNKEVLWASSKSYWSDIQKRSFARLDKYENELVPSNLAPTLRVAEQFYSQNGVPIEEDNSYDYEGRYSLKESTDAHRYFIKEGEKTVALHFDREARFYASLGFDRGIWFGSGKYIPEEGLNVVRTRGGEPAGQYNVTDYSITGYWPKKLVHIKTAASSDGWNLSEVNYPFPIMRLADLYLLKAEVANEIAAAPTADVYEYIDKVRARAGLKGVVEAWRDHSKYPDKPTSKAGMREIIHRERLIELCMEGQRFWDLRRWKEAERTLNSTIKGWKMGGISAEEFYQVTILYNQTFSVKDYFWPIQEYRIVENPKLVQNKGW